MDFDLNEEQSLLQDSIRRTLADRYGFEQRKQHLAARGIAARPSLAERLRRALRALRGWWGYRPERRYMRG